jgi:hypothetical protein
MVGSTVTTSTGAGVQPQHHPTGEAADIRHRHGGQWRASTPGVKPGCDATEPVGANFHHQPAHGGARMSNETAAQEGGIPAIHGREDVNL